MRNGECRWEAVVLNDCARRWSAHGPQFGQTQSITFLLICISANLFSAKWWVHRARISKFAFFCVSFSMKMPMKFVTLLAEERCHDGIDDVAQIYRISIASVKRIRLNTRDEQRKSIKFVSLHKIDICSAKCICTKCINFDRIFGLQMSHLFWQAQSCDKKQQRRTEKEKNGHPLETSLSLVTRSREKKTMCNWMTNLMMWMKKDRHCHTNTKTRFFFHSRVRCWMRRLCTSYSIYVIGFNLKSETLTIVIRFHVQIVSQIENVHDGHIYWVSNASIGINIRYDWHQR